MPTAVDALLFGGVPGAPELIVILLILVLLFVPTMLLLGGGTVVGYLLFFRDDDADEGIVDAETGVLGENGGEREDDDERELEDA